MVLDGDDVTALGAARIARLGLAHAPEGRKVFAPLSAEDNLLLGAYRSLPRFFGFRRRAAADLDRVYALFPKLAERRKQRSVADATCSTDDCCGLCFAAMTMFGFSNML